MADAGGPRPGDAVTGRTGARARLAVGALLREAASRMRRPGDAAEAALDAELLLAHAAGVGREWLYAHPDFVPSAETAAVYEGMVRERAEGRCPVAYLTGRREFCGLILNMERGVFIPRPETEGLVDLAVSEWARLFGRAGGLVVDVGCGSGAIAVAVARSLRVNVLAMDLSESAVRLTRENAAAAGVADLVSVRFGRGLAPLSERGAGKVDAVVSNPPYVRSSVIEDLDPGVRDFEPRAALDGGMDGLEVVREIAAEARHVLSSRGFLALEIGSDQGDEVGRLLRGGGWREVRIERDLAGFQRYAIARPPAEGNRPVPCGTR